MYSFKYITTRGLLQEFVHGCGPSAWLAIGAGGAFLPSPYQGQLGPVTGRDHQRLAMGVH